MEPPAQFQSNDPPLGGWPGGGVAVALHTRRHVYIYPKEERLAPSTRRDMICAS